MACHPEQDVQPDMFIDNIQPDIFTCDIRTSWNRFDALPREIRAQIYPYIIEEEQHNIREWGGNNKSLFSTQLFKTRPPALIRVGRVARAEYLQLYFRETCFIIPVDIGKPAVPEEITTSPITTLQAWENEIVIQNENCVTIDEATKNWLNSINSSDGVVFRNVQFRLTHQSGVPIGASFNISYDAKDRKCRGEFVLDAGAWSVGSDIESIPFVGLKAAMLPHYAWEVLRKAAEGATEEFLDWNFLQRLMELLGPTTCYEEVEREVGDDSQKRVRNWSAEVGIGEGEGEGGGPAYSSSEVLGKSMLIYA